MTEQKPRYYDKIRELASGIKITTDQYGFVTIGEKTFAPIENLFQLKERVNELEMKIEKPKVKIGDYYLSNYHDGTYWLEHTSGEGMQVSEDFECLVDNWYKAHF